MIFRPAFYAMTYALTAIGAVFVIALVIMVTGVNLGSSAVQFIPALAAAMIEGQYHAKSGAAAPTSQAMWRGAVAMTGLATGLLLLWTWLQLLPSGMVVTADILVRLGLMVVVYLLANRWFYQLGFRSADNDRAK